MTDDKKARLKCRFCKTTFARWRKLPDGEIVDGFETVAIHMRTYHEDEIAAINPEDCGL